MNFTYAFYKHILFRQSCGICPYTNTKRPSDITIADFWGWEKTNPEINRDDKGISLVLVNTEKGREIFDAVKDHMIVIPAKLEDCLQTHLKKPSDIHPKRMEFEGDYAKMGFERTFKKYALLGWKYKLAKAKELIWYPLLRILRIIKRKLKSFTRIL